MNRFKIITSVILMSFVLTGCQNESSNHSTEKNEEVDPHKEFFKPETRKFEGGVYLPDRQELRYNIVTNDQTFNIEMNIRNAEGCFKANGSVYVSAMNDVSNKRYEKLSRMKIQSKYHSSSEGVNGQFVHFIMDKDMIGTSCASYAILPEIDKEDYRTILYKYLFSEFNFNQNQLKLAKSELLHGSSQVMFYIKKYDLGVILDVNSKKLIGISVPKHKLITKYLFTSHRALLRTDRVEDLSLNPLILSIEDEKINKQAMDHLKHLNQVNEKMKNESEEDRKNLINSVWANFFRN